MLVMPAVNLCGALSAEFLSVRQAQTLYLLGDAFLYPAAMAAAVMVAATALVALWTGVLARWLTWPSLVLALWLLIPPLGQRIDALENPAPWTGLAVLPLVLVWAAVTGGRAHDQAPRPLTRRTGGGLRRRRRPRWSDLPRDVAGQGQQRPHHLVAAVRGRAEHARAAAVDHGDAVLAAVLGGGWRDAAGAGAAVHPHVRDPELGALAHRALGPLGPGADDHAVDAAGDRAQVVVAAVALDLVGVRVDREDLVARSRRRL